MTTVNNSHISLLGQDLLLLSSICPFDEIIEFGNDSLRNQNVIFKESIRPLLVTFYGCTEGSSGGSELNLIFRNCSVNLVSLFPHSIIVLCWQMGRISSPRNTPPLNIECVIIRYQCSISQKQQWWQQQDPSWRWERTIDDEDDEGNIDQNNEAESFIGHVTSREGCVAIVPSEGWLWGGHCCRWLLLLCVAHWSGFITAPLLLLCDNEDCDKDFQNGVRDFAT